MIAWLCSARALTVLLLVSLAANLLLGGVLVAPHCRRNPAGLSDPAQHSGDDRAATDGQARTRKTRDQCGNAAGAASFGGAPKGSYRTC